MSEQFSGRCQRGAVSYEVFGESLTLFACHCTECQKQSSSAFGMALWIKTLSAPKVYGKLKSWERNLPGGKIMCCDFCPTCGTRLFHRVGDQSNVVSIKPGTLDNTTGLRPVAHIWTKSAQCWLCLDECALLYAGNPDSFEPAIDAWANRKANQ